MAVEKKLYSINNLLEILLFVLREYTAGNPMKINVLWTNLTLVQIQEKLKSHCISVSCPVIKKLLKICGYVKRKMNKCKTLKEVENRNEQFEHIAVLKQEFIENKLPVLSIDTKKKEMIGNFYRSGEVFCREAQAVNDHDFNSFADGITVPHGIYDVVENICYLTVGTNKDTDAQWIAELLYKNMVRGSLVPSPLIQKLRSYTREYSNLVNQWTTTPMKVAHKIQYHEREIERAKKLMV